MYVCIHSYVCILFGQIGLLGASIETSSKICCSNIKLFLIIYLDAII